MPISTLLAPSASRSRFKTILWVSLGLTVLFVELIVYVPIAIVERASLDNGLNYLGDTLMFCGAVLLLAGAMSREHQTAPTESVS